MNILKKICFVGAAAAVIVTFLPINAQSNEIPARGPIPFNAYDKDGNGLISENEFNTIRGERMAKSGSEGRPMRGLAGAPAFSALDTNGDGQLNQDELAAGQKAQMEKRGGMKMGQGKGMGQGRGMGRNMPAFSEYDLNGDGKLLEMEFNKARGKRISERAQQGYQMRNIANAPSFADIDTNGNGEISPDEFATHQDMHRQQRAQ